MGLKFSGLVVSKNYRWHEEDREFRDIRTGELRSDVLYEAKVDVYDDRVQTWFLDCATSLLGQDNFAGDYVAVSVSLAYIEGVEQYRQGRDTPDKKAGKWFKNSAKRILPGTSSDEIDMLYKSARNGLFHSGFTTGRVYLNHDEPKALTCAHNSVLRINPNLFVESVVEDFKGYIQKLRQSRSSKAAKLFEALWDKRWHAS